MKELFLQIIYSLFSRWYHGRLDRIGAEERVRSHRGSDGTNLGSYLVRESDRKPGIYLIFCIYIFQRSGDLIWNRSDHDLILGSDLNIAIWIRSDLKITKNDMPNFSKATF